MQKKHFAVNEITLCSKSTDDNITKVFSVSLVIKDYYIYFQFFECRLFSLCRSTQHQRLPVKTYWLKFESLIYFSCRTAKFLHKIFISKCAQYLIGVNENIVTRSTKIVHRNKKSTMNRKRKRLQVWVVTNQQLIEKNFQKASCGVSQTILIPYVFMQS